MGVRAVIAVRDDSGHERRFWAPWASKRYQIRYLAQFIHTADHDGTPLNVDGYLAYTATRPDTLPAQDITEQGGYADPTETGDLDHRYQLLLGDRERTFCYIVYDRLPHWDPNRWLVSHDLGTRGDLYEAAARMCQQLATNAQRYMNSNNGVTRPGDPGPEHWREQEREFTGWLRRTDPRLLHLGAPPPVARRYTLTAARALARQVNARLRHHYPGVTIRTRVGPDGVCTMTVPARLATDTEASLITHVVGDVLDQPYTVSVRPHRPSRYGAPTGYDGTRPAVNATLTLRPVGTADPAATAAAEDHASR